MNNSRRGPLLLHMTTVPMTLTFLRGAVRAMQDRGFGVHIVSATGPELDSFAAAHGVTATPVEMVRRIAPLTDLLALVRLTILFRRLRPDIVHAHTPKAGLLGMMAAFMAGVPVRIYHVRGAPLMTARGLRRVVLRQCEQLACGLSHRVICVSRGMQQYLREERLCADAKTVVLARGSGAGVDAEEQFNPQRHGGERDRIRARLSIPSDALVVGFIGRVVRDKGIAELVTAWLAVHDTLPVSRLLVIGPLEPQDPVGASVENVLRSHPGICYVGADWNVAPYYTAMDVLVLPTYREGFPNVLLEAAAMELPVIASRIPGCDEAVQDGVTGTLVAPRDPAALAAAIQMYAADAALRRAHGTAGRARVLRDFRPADIWSALHAEYLRALNPRVGEGPDIYADGVGASPGSHSATGFARTGRGNP
jgi:glycosyltransferase involved in cell wall biosynthesis